MRGDDRSVAAILKKIDAMTLPRPDLSRWDDKAYVEQFMKQRSEIRVRRAELIGVVYRLDPDHPRLATLLPVRWRSLSGWMAGPDDNKGAKDLTGEMNEVIARSRSDKLKTDAAYLKAEIAVDPLDRLFAAKDKAAKAKSVDEFIAFAPKDERGAELLDLLSLSFKDEPAEQMALYARIIKEYPDSSPAEMARGKLRQLDPVGKPFVLEFTEAKSGAVISMKGLKGKVVVIDFWATWCGPCVAEMPALKKLYAEYKDRGVEFIGVSLDYKDGGLDQLKAFVTKEEIAWPQYFQGDGFASNFSTSWGINSIPVVFLVDQEGKLFSVEARGKLETMIPELLNRSVPKAEGDGRR